MKFKCPKCGGDQYIVIDRYVKGRESFEIQCDSVTQQTNKGCNWEQIVSEEEVAIFSAQRYVIAQAEKKRAKKKK